MSRSEERQVLVYRPCRGCGLFGTVDDPVHTATCPFHWDNMPELIDCQYDCPQVHTGIDYSECTEQLCFLKRMHDPGPYDPVCKE